MSRLGGDMLGRLAGRRISVKVLGAALRMSGNENNLMSSPLLYKQMPKRNGPCQKI